MKTYLVLLALLVSVPETKNQSNAGTPCFDLDDGFEICIDAGSDTLIKPQCVEEGEDLTFCYA
jgi:hypothetical protein